MPSSLWLRLAGAAEPPKAAAILAEHCLKCHNSSVRMSGLSLASAADARKGGLHGPAIVPGKPEESLLVRMISGENRRKPKMPMQGAPLSPAEVAEIRTWIEQGALWPDAAVAGSGKAALWSLQPLQEAAGSASGIAPGAQPHRCLRGRQAGGEEADAVAGGGCGDLDPPAHLRSARPAAHVGRDSGLRRRPLAGRLREAGRPAARLAALRRALGAALAGCGALRRIARLRQGQAAAQCLAVSRLRDPRVQRGQAVRALRGGATRRRRAVARRSARRRSPPDSSPPGRGISSATRNCAKAPPTRRSRGCSIATTW